MTLRLCAIALIGVSSAASASDLSNIGTLTQGEFHALSEDLAAAFSYKGVTPATSLGITGADFGFEVSDTRVENADALHRAGGGSSDIWVPKLHAYKRLPAGFDIGAFVGGGTVRARSSVDNSGLETETFSRGRGFLGANLNLVGANLAFEAERSGSTTTLSAKVGVRF